MTTALQEIPLVDEHRHVKKNGQRCREMEEKHARATAHREALVAEQKRLRSTTHGAEVNRLMGDGSGAQEADVARLAQLDTEIASATAEEHALRDALEIQQTIAHGVRKQVEREMHEQIATTVRDTLADMEPQVAKLIETNHHLAALAQRAPGTLVPTSQFLEMWLSQVRGLVGDR